MTLDNGLLVFVYPIPQLFARLEMRDELTDERDGLTGFRVTAYTRCSVMEGKTAETPDLDAVAGGKRLSHLLEHGLDGQLDILGRKKALLGDDTFDQLRLGHGFPFVFKRLDHLGCDRL